ncbi:hypothetical protein BS17DRAFT_103506 [Gyrodon lividus]|nr:hypothetical protein BS17DRAFT_103506 [Gyrodon lividus]
MFLAYHTDTVTIYCTIKLPLALCFSLHYHHDPEPWGSVHSHKGSSFPLNPDSQITQCCIAATVLNATHAGVGHCGPSAAHCRSGRPGGMSCEIEVQGLLSLSKGCVYIVIVRVSRWGPGSYSACGGNSSTVTVTGRVCEGQRKHGGGPAGVFPSKDSSQLTSPAGRLYI